MAGPSELRHDGENLSLRLTGEALGHTGRVGIKYCTKLATFISYFLKCLVSWWAGQHTFLQVIK